MKKILLVVLCLAIPALTFAYDDPYQTQPKMAGSSYADEVSGFGIHGGFNSSNLTGDDVDNTDPKIGLLLGVYYKNILNPNVSLQFEANYSMRGASTDIWIDDGYGGTIVNGDLNLAYLEFPVLLQFQPSTASNATFRIGAGVVPALCISARLKADEYDIDEDVKDQMKDLIIDAVFDAGVDFETGNGRFNIDLRYIYGLTNVFDEGDADIKHTVISLLAGYKFN